MVLFNLFLHGIPGKGKSALIVDTIVHGHDVIEF